MVILPQSNVKIEDHISRDFCTLKNMIIDVIIKETDEANFKRQEKIFTLQTKKKILCLTINSYTNRIITADKLKK